MLDSHDDRGENLVLGERRQKMLSADEMQQRRVKIEALKDFYCVNLQEDLKGSNFDRAVFEAFDDLIKIFCSVTPTG